MAGIRNQDYNLVSIILENLKSDLEQLKPILANHDNNPLFFDVDLNRHLYLQVQTFCD